MSEAEDKELWLNAVTQAIRQQLEGSLGLVDDIDHILADDIIAALAFESREVTFVSNSLMLRFDYENRVRHTTSEQSSSTLYVLGIAVAVVPYDIQAACSIVRLSLKQFFPGLSYQVMRELPSIWRARIYAVQQRMVARRMPLNDLETARFIFQTCLGLQLPSQADLAGLLDLIADLALYDLEIPKTLYSSLLPPGFDVEAQALLSKLESSQSIRVFLQQVWQAYTDRLLPGSRIAEPSEPLIAQSAICLESQRSLWTKFSALLASSVLMPAILPTNIQMPSWMRAGMHYVQDQSAVVTQALEQIAYQIPAVTSQWQDWVSFAYHWATSRVAYYRLVQPASAVSQLFEAVHNRIEGEFTEWLLEQYPSLLQQPYLPQPTMVHQVAYYLAAAYRPTPDHSIALVVVDGMALEDWLIIQSEWKNSGLNWQINPRGVLALVPTLTSVSRQALFAGKLPRYFESDWLTTRHESLHWRIFWEEHGLRSENIDYLRSLGRSPISANYPLIEPEIDEALARPNTAVSAFVVNSIDDFVHGVTLGVSALHQQVRWWAGQYRYLQALVARLLEKVDTVIITADHGHVEGRGIGELRVNDLAEEVALRVQMLNTKHSIDAASPGKVIRWLALGLPTTMQVFLPKGLGIFAAPSQSGISHGGAALEEVVVPFVTVTR